MTGFTITKDWITLAEEAQLVGRIRARLNEATEKDSRGGRSAILRFGWDYNDENVWVRDIPEWLIEIRGKLAEIKDWLTDTVQALAPEDFDSITINFYRERDQILPHIDSAKFGQPILILSLLSNAEMRFGKPGVSAFGIVVPQRGLVSLSGEARYDYRHAIPPVHGERISVVFRKRLLEYKGIGRLIAVKQDIYEDG